jgi:hypothetical protein
MKFITNASPSGLYADWNELLVKQKYKHPGNVLWGLNTDTIRRAKKTKDSSAFR